MQHIELESWEDLESEICKLEQFLAGQKHQEHQYVAKPLFRGQSSADWSLQTSLERYVVAEVSLESYNRYLLRIKPAVEAYTGRTWNLERNIAIVDTFHSATNYEFMVYARHHGFPSPLLDWSQSCYVALFFAYQHAVDERPVSIFAYVDDLGCGKGGWAGKPQISAQGPYVSSHRRHFMQQSQYTIATEKCEERWVYCAHEKCLGDEKQPEQDLLIKFSLPGRQKIAYLQRLQQMNIHAFTLYGTEESLMEMLAFREIVGRDR